LKLGEKGDHLKMLIIMEGAVTKEINAIKKEAK
jgi:hypothetical protein